MSARHSPWRPKVAEQVLRLCDLAPDDNFFELGGHSMVASQVSSRIRDALRVDVSLAVFFERPTIAGLTAYVLSWHLAENEGWMTGYGRDKRRRLSVLTVTRSSSPDELRHHPPMADVRGGNGRPNSMVPAS